MRYLPLTEADRREMLAKIGAKSIDELFRDVPQSARLGGKVAGRPDHVGELEVERAFQAYAAKNVSPGSAPFSHRTAATIRASLRSPHAARCSGIRKASPRVPRWTRATCRKPFSLTAGMLPARS